MVELQINELFELKHLQFRSALFEKQADKTEHSIIGAKDDAGFIFLRAANERQVEPKPAPGLGS